MLGNTNNPTGHDDDLDLFFEGKAGKVTVRTPGSVNYFPQYPQPVIVDIPYASKLKDGLFTANSVTKVTIPNVSVILSRTFASCSMLREITGDKVGATINAFSDCTSLTTVNLPECYDIEREFAGCTALSEISLPKLETILTGFRGCPSLTTVNFPKCSVIENAFAECTALEEITLPSLSEIFAPAFSGCVRLISLYLPGSSVAALYNSAALSNYVFVSTPIGGYSKVAGRYGSVFVPASLVGAYKSALGWSSIASRITALT